MSVKTTRRGSGETDRDEGKDGGSDQLYICNKDAANIFFLWGVSRAILLMAAQPLFSPAGSNALFMPALDTSFNIRTLKRLKV
jgi:hypothetical protein